MTNTLTIVDRQVEGLNRVVYAKMDITSYTTDGETLSATLFGLDTLKYVECSSSEKGVIFAVNEAMTKVLAFSAIATQQANTTDVGVVRLRGVGN